MQVCLYRHRRSKTEVEAAEFTGNNFLAMNTWTGDSMRWINVHAQRCLLIQGDSKFACEPGDWVVKDSSGRFFVYAGRHFKLDYKAVTA